MVCYIDMEASKVLSQTCKFKNMCIQLFVMKFTGDEAHLRELFGTLYCFGLLIEKSWSYFANMLYLVSVTTIS